MSLSHRLLIPLYVVLLTTLAACASKPITGGPSVSSPSATSPSVRSLSASEHAALTQQVIDAERAFARSMADRDHAAFSQWLADEAVFFSGTQVLRGKAAVINGWQAFFSGAAPFSWQPEQVEVQADGQLALSTGPVFDPNGKLVARFTSIWQQQAPGVWRVIFDRGNPVCPPAASP